MEFNLENALKKINLKSGSQTLTDSSNSLSEGNSFERSLIPIEALNQNVRNLLTKFPIYVQ